MAAGWSSLSLGRIQTKRHIYTFCRCHNAAQTGDLYMFKITKISANRVDIELSGTLDADDMRTLLDELIATRQ